MLWPRYCPGYLKMLERADLKIRIRWGLSICVAAAGLVFAYGQLIKKPLEGVTFATSPGALYVPVREFAQASGKSVGYDEDSGAVTVGGVELKKSRLLPDGTTLMRVREADGIGANVDWRQDENMATVRLKGAEVEVVPGVKHVIIDKHSQTLKAFQGGRLLMNSRVSTGKEGHGTPNGTYHAGPTKQRMHRSRLYHWAPMPWSVQVDGNVFIHGYTSVPNHPASHGCIRLPLTGHNPARWFFNWVDVGTPVTIEGRWAARHKHHLSHAKRVRHRRHRVRRRFWYRRGRTWHHLTRSRAF